MWSFWGVVQDGYIVVYKLEFHSRYYVHLWANTLLSIFFINLTVSFQNTLPALYEIRILAYRGQAIMDKLI